MLAPPGPIVIEAARDDALQAIANPVLIGELLLRHLAHRVGAERAQRVLLRSSALHRQHQAVLLGRAGDLDARIEPPAVLGVERAQRLEEVQLRR